MRIKMISGALAAAGCLVATSQAAPVAVDLSTWTAEGQGTWNLADDANSVTQTVNGDPTVFFNGIDSQGLALSGTIEVQTTGDDDFIGFVLGFNAGGTQGGPNDFILIDWKQGNQSLYGGVGEAGLAVSRVTGALDDDSGAWWHDSSDGVEELARAINLGGTGWEDNTVYDFRLVFTETLIQVFVNDVLEIDITGTFANGSFGFYNYSQANVRYGAIEEAVVPPTDAVPLPAAAFLFVPVLAAGMMARRRGALG